MKDPAERRAILELVLSAVCFGVMAFSAKLAAARLSGAEVAAMRFAIGLVPFLVIPGVLRRAFAIERYDLLFYRGFFGGVAVLLYFMAIEHIAVGLATLLNYTAPLASGVFAWLLLGEPLARRTYVPLLVAIAGVIVVVNAHARPGELLGFGRWELVGVVSAVLSGAAVTAIRASRRTESSWSIYGSFGVLGLLATGPFAIATWLPPTPREWGLLAACGGFSIAAQLLMTHAYRWIDNVRAGAIAQLAVGVALACGVLTLGEPFGWQAAFGTLMTIGGVLATLRAPRAAPPADLSASPATIAR
jgi:drug/metabolite transporter (DMT)-like permease